MSNSSASFSDSAEAIYSNGRLSHSGGGLVTKLCLTLMIPRTVACHVPLSMGFSRQEYWSGHLSFLQGIFLIQGLNPGFQHCGEILYHLRHQGSPTRVRTDSNPTLSNSSIHSTNTGASQAPTRLALDQGPPTSCFCK